MWQAPASSTCNYLIPHLSFLSLSGSLSEALAPCPLLLHLFTLLDWTHPIRRRLHLPQVGAIAQVPSPSPCSLTANYSSALHHLSLGFCYKAHTYSDTLQGTLYRFQCQQSPGRQANNSLTSLPFPTPPRPSDRPTELTSCNKQSLLSFTHRLSLLTERSTPPVLQPWQLPNLPATRKEAEKRNS